MLGRKAREIAQLHGLVEDAGGRFRVLAESLRAIAGELDGTDGRTTKAGAAKELRALAGGIESTAGSYTAFASAGSWEVLRQHAVAGALALAFVTGAVDGCAGAVAEHFLDQAVGDVAAARDVNVQIEAQVQVVIDTPDDDPTPQKLLIESIERLSNWYDEALRAKIPDYASTWEGVVRSEEPGLLISFSEVIRSAVAEAAGRSAGDLDDGSDTSLELSQIDLAIQRLTSRDDREE
jgi:hypothetical protein